MHAMLAAACWEEWLHGNRFRRFLTLHHFTLGPGAYSRQEQAMVPEVLGEGQYLDSNILFHWELLLDALLLHYTGG